MSLVLSLDIGSISSNLILGKSGATNCDLCTNWEVCIVLIKLILKQIFLISCIKLMFSMIRLVDPCNFTLNLLSGKSFKLLPSSIIFSSSCSSILSKSKLDWLMLGIPPQTSYSIKYGSSFSSKYFLFLCNTTLDSSSKYFVKLYICVCVRITASVLG